MDVTHTKILERLLLFAGGLLLIDPGLLTDIAGLVLIGGIYALQKFRKKNAAQTAAM